MFTCNASNRLRSKVFHVHVAVGVELIEDWFHLSLDCRWFEEGSNSLERLGNVKSHVCDVISSHRYYSWKHHFRRYLRATYFRQNL